jgi:hypothetical protein
MPASSATKFPLLGMVYDRSISFYNPAIHDQQYEHAIIPQRSYRALPISRA